MQHFYIKCDILTGKINGVGEFFLWILSL